MKCFFLSLLFSFVTACASISPDENGRLPEHYGGNILKNIEIIENHKGPVILDGVYFSAGTMWLGHPQACVTKDAQFKFHAPHKNGFPVEQNLHTWGVRKMAEYYPAPLNEWFVKTYAKTGWRNVYAVKTFTGQEIIDMGAGVECSLNNQP